MNKMKITPELLQYCREVRRHLHRNPEISFEEEKTSEYILEELNKLGLQGKRLAGTGVYTVIEADQPGPVIAVRADIDALPVQEKNDVSYASTVPGVAHVCGHDGHVAVLMGLAAMLKKYNNDVLGKVILIFQPAEELLPGGAVSVIGSGLLEGVDSILGMHLTTLLPTGTISLRSGSLMASINEFCVKVIGRGGHGSRPHDCIDPIIVGTQLVNAWQSIISRGVNPLEAAVLTVGSFNAGTAANIIPETAVLKGTVRTLSEKVRERIKNNFLKLTEEICKAYGASADISYENGYPVLINDERITNIIGDAAISNSIKLFNMPRPVMGSEDFAYYGHVCPAAYFFLGAGNVEKGYVHPNHSPYFNFDEESLPVGVQVILTTLERLWAEERKNA